jgi:hypothetical protein
VRKPAGPQPSKLRVRLYRVEFSHSLGHFLPIQSPVVMSGSTSSGRVPDSENDVMGQSTKSLRDNPLRGGPAAGAVTN